MHSTVVTSFRRDTTLRPPRHDTSKETKHESTVVNFPRIRHTSSKLRFPRCYDHRSRHRAESPTIYHLHFPWPEHDHHRCIVLNTTPDARTSHYPSSHHHHAPTPRPSLRSDMNDASLTPLPLVRPYPHVLRTIGPSINAGASRHAYLQRTPCLPNPTTRSRLARPAEELLMGTGPQMATKFLFHWPNAALPTVAIWPLNRLAWI